MLNGDKIYVEDLRVKATIGIFDWEKKIKQDVSISYEIPHDNVKAAKADAIEATTDYKSITKGIISFVENNKFELVETFAEKIAEMVIKDFNIDEIRLRVSKPGALRFSKDVGVIIERDKSSYE
ncbi:MAG: dihydroneopterin aldolase [Pseudomonadota bacterium]|jgi:dihydroneopterin aldolase|nr:dihydroneopterin aldolase [Pseudomonadota bacterium]MEC8153189.1 dihydroneopterin aldolase [Pseudomonadota bacterium]|tara:strand:+ start:30383 stop:30754 length:372 start_codon:yes stop_codon:yes gene_type:complete